MEYTTNRIVGVRHVSAYWWNTDDIQVYEIEPLEFDVEEPGKYQKVKKGKGWVSTDQISIIYTKEEAAALPKLQVFWHLFALHLNDQLRDGKAKLKVERFCASLFSLSRIRHFFFAGFKETSS